MLKAPFLDLRPNLRLDSISNIANLSTSNKVKSVALMIVALWRYWLQMYQRRLNRECVYFPLLQCIASAFHRSTALDSHVRDVLHPLRSFAFLHQSRRVRSAARLPWQLFLSRRGHWRVKRTDFLNADNVAPSSTVTVCPFTSVHISCSPLSKVLRRAPPSSRLNGVTRLQFAFHTVRQSTLHKHSTGYITVFGVLNSKASQNLVDMNIYI